MFVNVILAQLNQQLHKDFPISTQQVAPWEILVLVSIFNTAHRCFMLQCFSLPLNSSMGRAEVLAALVSISFQQWARNNWTNVCRKNKSGSPALGHNKVIGNRFVFLLWKSLNQKLNYMGQAGRLIPTWNKAYDWLGTSQISNLHDWEKNPEGIGNVWE